MRSLRLSVLIFVMLLVATAAQANDKDIVVPGSYPAADLKSYTNYENVLDTTTLFADRLVAQQKSLKTIIGRSLIVASTGEMSSGDQLGNDWWSEQPVIMTGTGAQLLKRIIGRSLIVASTGEMSSGDQLGNDWWSEQSVIMIGTEDQLLKTSLGR